ncbi:hypothetical protein EV426DRAFT_435464 [Tirmania nivea]|nr:hypothetical protein EV426DRAFT_435464 [Tirmania nivea]
MGRLNASAMRALGVGFGPVQKLSPRLCRGTGTFDFNSKAFLVDSRKTNIPQHVFSYPMLASSLPGSASRRPFSNILYIRTYASIRRIPPPASVRQESKIIPPDVPEPEQQVPDPEDFALKRKIKYVERGFLAVFIVLYIVYERTRASVLLKHKKEMEEQAKEIISQGGKLPTNITIRMGGLQDPLIEGRVLSTAGGDNKDGVPTPGPDSFIQELELNLSTPDKLFLLIRNNFEFSPVKLFPVDGSTEMGYGFRPWTAVTASLLHGHIFHLFACYFSLKVFTSPFILLYGTQKFLGLFFAGAGLAATLYAGVERMVNPAVSMTPEQLQRVRNADPMERKEVLRYFGPSVGSSGALVALGTIAMFVAPWVRASLLISPPMNIRTIMSILFAFDVGGQFFFDYGLNINHGVHLGGYAAGLILYRTVVRKWPFSRHYQQYFGTYFGARNRQVMH